MPATRWGTLGPNRLLEHYPLPAARRRHLALVVVITIALYYALYVGGGVAPLVMAELRISFGYLVVTLAVGSAAGAFASLLAGLTDRFGRARLVVWGLLIVAILTLLVPLVHDRLSWAVIGVVVGFVEGVILVATPALIRDFSPQVGRAAAMGFWTIGPVLGSLLVSVVTSATLPVFASWRSQYVICGALTFVVFVLAFLFLRELKPELRDQLMVNERDRVLNELRARGLDIAASLRHPWRQMLRPDILFSAFGVSVLLLAYYTAVAFGVIYIVTVYGFTPARANALLNWSWGTNAASLILVGLCSDRLRVRKPFMLVGGVGSAVTIWVFLAHGATHPTFPAMAGVACLISVLMGAAYVCWMASFTETIEAHNPALTATGLAIWGWLLRLVVTASFLSLPHVVTTVTPLVEAPPVLAAFAHARAAGAVPPALAARVAEIGAAAKATPGQWQFWFAICAAGAAAFVVLIFLMKGRWSSAAARADEAAHDAAVAAALAARGGSEATAS